MYLKYDLCQNRENLEYNKVIEKLFYSLIIFKNLSKTIIIKKKNRLRNNLI